MATKKITELPLIQTISGSFSVVPIVIGNTAGNGTTDQITIENFREFVIRACALTGSAGNTFVGPQTINNNVTINGNEVVNGNVTISGKLTVYEVVAQYETASVLFSSGSNKFGDAVGDKHEFTGSSNFVGSVYINGQDYTTYSSSNSTVFTNYSSSNSVTFTNYSSSNSTLITNYSSSINSTLLAVSSSINTNIYAVSGSINATLLAVSSSINTNIYAISSSINTNIYTISASIDNTIKANLGATNDVVYRIQQATASLELASASFNYFYQSTASLQTFTASQADRNLVLSTVTGSINQATASIQSQTASLLTFTASQDSRNFTLSQVTGSFRGEIGGLEAYSASLKAAAIVSSSTQVQNYDLFALNSNLYTATGSLIGITNGLMAFTAALDNTYATDAQLLPILQATRSLELLSGSLIGITNGLMAFTAALDSTYATDAQLYQLYAETASIKAEIAGIELYTASLKAAAIVSSSTQVQNYDVFALNSNLYNSTGSIKGEIAGIEAYTASLKGAIEVSGQNVNVLGMITAQQFNVTYVSSSVMYQSGSTEFGDSSDDRHLFTGSLIVSGTLAAGTDETGWGRISFNESTNTLRIQSSKNGTQCTPISFWSQRDGGTFAESMTISGSNIGIGISNPNLSAGAAGSTILTLSATTSARNSILELNGTRTNATDVTGYLRFFNNSAATPLADIRALRGSSDTAGELEFQTANVGRMKITEGGILEMRPITFSSVANNAVQTVIPSMGKGTWLVSVANDVDSSDGYSAMLWVRTNEIIEMQVFRADSMVFSYTNQDLKIQNTSGFAATLYVTAIRMAAS